MAVGFTYVSCCVCMCITATATFYGRQLFPMYFEFEKKWPRIHALASSTAFGGIKMRGKAYMAPWTGLHLIPGTAFRICSVSLAFSAKAPNTAVFS